jgi:hypothetical protein
MKALLRFREVLRKARTEESYCSIKPRPQSFHGSRPRHLVARAALARGARPYGAVAGAATAAREGEGAPPPTHFTAFDLAALLPFLLVYLL